MDFKKAFDTVPHQRLLANISNYGIKGKVLQWIKIFLLTNRKSELVNGSFSRWVEVLSGIPEGSVLGPGLFVLFINDPPENVKANIYLFADDNKFCREIATRNDQVITGPQLTTRMGNQGASEIPPSEV